MSLFVLENNLHARIFVPCCLKCIDTDIRCRYFIRSSLVIDSFIMKYCYVYVQVWHSNMPHNKLADRKAHQGWMKREGQYFLFPGGGTMFTEGAAKYIEKLGQYIPISGGIIRTALDMGCGVGVVFLYLI